MKTKYFAATTNSFGNHAVQVVSVKNIQIALFKVGENYYAWNNRCPHAAAPLCAGTVCGTMLPSQVYEYDYGKEGEIVRCPWHNWEFDLKTGELLADSSVKLRGYELSREDEELYIWI
ncbi:Rieske (2Fe-2S) protein [Paenibacillus sp. HB172176]|uniref:Rieske (2Fe-2S) protein n=1 Tax=Paenibacillus sp. HB172176 TaxID=2493690 RepID=UPI0014399448|nr:Rieske (2Fe-2S) protein [Paenibacillus sp. HB172176]